MDNRLGEESSLYLRQHADNPVHWQPWDARALEAARASRRPILLSIGYSACHWCHVMAHESFEDPDIAAVMNGLFVNIKVDREERPDLDRIYQLAHQALNRRSGGWPLTVFLDPGSLLPFYTGTYFPPRSRYNLPGFAEVLRAVRRWWDERPGEVARQNEAMAEFLQRAEDGVLHGGELDDTPIRRARERIADGFDPVNGGHRGAPKFPNAGELELLRELGRGGDAEAAAMAERTLAAMADRGLFDHLGGGFFRYCVDEDWSIPHFEKMLYDNAQLLPLYAEHGAGDGPAQARDAAERVAGWLRSGMLADDGGLCSALDADSPGGEGAYYVWRREEVAELLDEADYRLFAMHFGLERPPNFEGEAWHLLKARPLDACAQALGIAIEAARRSRERAIALLLQRRRERPPPARDDKRLTAWNAIAVAGLARAGRALDRPDFTELAADIADFLLRETWRDGILHASYADGRARFPGYLDDHAFLLDALLELLSVRWEARWLDAAVALGDTLLERFEDRDGGGFYFTAHDHEPLPQRPKPWFDQSTPSGNGVAARALLQLGWLLAEPRWLDAAERTLRGGWEAMSDAPNGCTTLLRALAAWQAPPPLLVLRTDAGEATRWNQALAATRAAGGRAFSIPADGASLPDALAGKPHVPGGRAYLCRGRQCSEPVDDPEALLAQL